MIIAYHIIIRYGHLFIFSPLLSSVASLMLACMLSTSVGAQETEEYVFTPVKELKITPVKNQNRTGTCWSFSGIGFLEAELLRMGEGVRPFGNVCRKSFL